jgi:RNase adaptor protein for sRNA GlmZ degradation
MRRSGLSAAGLRRKVADELLEPENTGKLAVTFTSFGHKHGPPRDADLAFDVDVPDDLDRLGRLPPPVDPTR